MTTPDSDVTNILTETLRLVAHGLPVFPCEQTSKRPLTPHGFKDASTDADLVREWWSRYPDALIGVPTGIRFVVVDLDLQHADAQSWYQGHRARLPLTRMHVTRSGGRHLLFKPTSRVGCSTSRLGPHIDTRGLGGYVVWWPACGLEVLHGGALAAVPDWIIAVMQAAPEVTRLPPRPVRLSDDQAHNKLAGILRTIALAQEGERNALAFWGACRLAEMVAAGLLSQTDALALAIEAASRAGLSRAEAQRTAQSALRRGIA
jgi:hypothetical protein